MATLLLPKLLEVFSLSHAKGKRSLLNCYCFLAELVKQLALDSELAESDVTSVWVHSWVDEFKLWVTFLYCFFHLLPVDFKLFSFGNLGAVGDNNGVVEVFFHKNYFSVLVVLIFLGFTGLFLFKSFLVALAIGWGGNLFRQWFVSDASDCVVLDLEFRRVLAGSLDVFNAPLAWLYIIAVKEVREGDVSFFGRLDLFSEKLVFGEVLVGEVVLDLGLDCSVVGHLKLN